MNPDTILCCGWRIYAITNPWRPGFSAFIAFTVNGSPRYERLYSVGQN